MNLKIQARHLAILAPFMAVNDIRYYLNGIHVRPYGSGVLLAATDGHTLGMIYDERGSAERPVTLKVTRALLQASKVRPPEFRRARGDLFVVAEDIEWNGMPADLPPEFRLVVKFCFADEPDGKETEVFVQARGAEVEAPGRFPDLERVIPKRENLSPGAPNGYQLRYLKRLPLVSSSRFGSVTAARFYSEPKEGKPVVIEVVGMPEFMALIMPVRDDGRKWGGSLQAWWEQGEAIPHSETGK